MNQTLVTFTPTFSLKGQGEAGSTARQAGTAPVTTTRRRDVRCICCRVIAPAGRASERPGRAY